MPLAQIPLTGGQVTNVEALGLKDKAELVENVLCDENGVNYSRPGLIQFANATIQDWTGQAQPFVIGLFPFKEFLVCITSDRKAFRFDYKGTIIDITGSAGVPGRGTPVSFLDDQGTLIIAAGGPPVAWNGVGKAELFSPNVWMPSATSLCNVGGHLVANHLSTPQWYWSTTVSHKEFSQGGQFATAETNLQLRSVQAFGGDAWLFGDKTIEVWYSTGQEQPQAFARYEHVIPVGLGAPRGVILADNQLYYFDVNQRAIRLDRYDPKVISYDIEREMQALLHPEDCIIHWIRMRGRNLLAWAFERDKKTFVYDLVLDAWYEWSRFDPTTGTKKPMAFSAYAYHPVWRRHFCAPFDQPIIYELSPDASTDLGEPIIRTRVTNHITHGAAKPKTSRALRIRAKRGQTTELDPAAQGQDPKFTLEWRDDDRPWGQPIQLSLGKSGQTDSYVLLSGMGIYRSRQYRFTVSEPTDWALVEISEDFDLNDE